MIEPNGGTEKLSPVPMLCLPTSGTGLSYQAQQTSVRDALPVQYVVGHSFEIQPQPMRNVTSGRTFLVQSYEIQHRVLDAIVYKSVSGLVGYGRLGPDYRLMGKPAIYEYKGWPHEPLTLSSSYETDVSPSWTGLWSLVSDPVELILASTLEVSSLPYKKQLIHRLHELNASLKEESPGKSISVESLADFIRFLNESTELKKPRLSVTPAGTLYAQWKLSAANRLSVDFLVDGNVHFILIKQNPVHLERSEKVVGATTRDLLRTRLVENGGWEIAAL